MKLAVTASSLFVFFAFAWFVTMELILQHPGFIPRAAIAMLVVFYAALALRYTHASTTALRHTLTVAALTAIWLGLFGLHIALRQTHFEGYLLLLALALFVQGLITVVHALQRPHLGAA